MKSSEKKAHIKHLVAAGEINGFILAFVCVHFSN